MAAFRRGSLRQDEHGGSGVGIFPFDGFRAEASLPIAK